jgi:hypothetical protein
MLTYIFVVTVTIILQSLPFASASSPVAFFSKTNLFTTPLQSLATASFGVLFSTTKTRGRGN